MDNKDRYLDLSSKFLQMGNALIIEGKERNDYVISQLGNFMILMGGLVLDSNDVQLFSQMCSMFSAKKILDNLALNKNDFIDYLKKKGSEETYEEFIKRINQLRDNNGFPPIE